MKPTTAHEWWEQERENQLYLAKLFYDRFGNKSATMWHCLFAWATPDIWRDPEYITKELAAGLKRTKEVVAGAGVFYGLPKSSVSALNASGKCVTDGETSPNMENT